MRNPAKTLIPLLLAAILAVASQAHFTARFTPNVAGKVDEVARMSWDATGVGRWLGFESFKTFFGVFDGLVALLLTRKRTRRGGVWAAMAGFAFDFWTAWVSGGELGEAAGLLGVAVVGVVFVG